MNYYLVSFGGGWFTVVKSTDSDTAITQGRQNFLAEGINLSWRKDVKTTIINPCELRNFGYTVFDFQE